MTVFDKALETIAAVGKEAVMNRVIDKLVDKEINKRVNIIETAMELLPKWEKEVQKFSVPDMVNFDQNGAETKAFSSQQWKNKQKAVENFTKLNQLLDECINNPSTEAYEKLDKLCTTAKSSGDSKPQS